MKKFYFFLFAALLTNDLLAQSPGGVSAGLSMWIRADAASTLSSTDSLNSWHYYNNAAAGYTFNAIAGSRPILQNNTLNFQPSVFFNGAQYMDGPTGNVAPGAPIPQGSQAYSVFGVWQTIAPAGAPQLQRVWEQKGAGSGNDGVAIWLNNNSPAPTKYGAQMEISPYTQGAVLPYTPNSWFAMQINVQALATSDLTIVDQTNLGTGGVTVNSDPVGGNALAARLNGLSTTINRLGARNVPLDAAQEAMEGNVAEVIVYTTPISGTQRTQIFSYLALKYGIHTGTNLLSSTGATIWDATANSTYNHAVFGVGMDLGSGLSLSKSNSINTGGGNGTGQNAAGNITFSNPTSLADGTFLILGNDNGALTEGTTNLPPAAAGSKRLGRQWKAQVTSTPGNVDVDVDLTGLAPTGTTTTDFRLIMDDDGDGNFATGPTRYYTPATYTSNVAHFSGVTLNNNTVMGVITAASGGTPLPVTWIGFTAIAAGNDVHLGWQVAANESGKIYEVEHSFDGVQFSSVGNVANYPSQKSYEFIHNNAGPGTHYYRIHEVDIDGKDIYSKILSVNIAAAAAGFSVRVLSNPVSGAMDPEVEIKAVKAENVSIEIWTEGGTRIGVLQQKVNIGTTRVRVPLSARPAATYFLKVNLDEGSRTVQVVKL
jgi:hypothetical protein